MSLFEENDLGAQDYSGEKESAFDSLVSKPVQRKFQPFGGPMPQAPQPQYEPVDYGYEVQPAQRQSNVFEELDAYDGIKKAHGQFKQYATENERSAKHYEGLYDDFIKNEFQPFFNSVGGFGDFDNDDEMLSFIDQMKADEVKASQEEDGFFGGASDRKIAAQENLKKFGAWDSPNGLRDKYLRLKAEKDRRRQTADAARNQEFQLFEQLTNIPIPARDAMDAQLKARSKAPLSKKKADEFMDQFSWEQPIVGLDGEAQNIEKTDPRKQVSPILSMEGAPSKSFQAQKQRLSAAMRGDINGVLARRDLVKKERNLRDKGIFFSQNGLIDGRPIGLSRNDVDLLDIAEMKAAGMTSYRGKPLEVAMEELGGEERLKAAKIMESVYGAKSNYEDAQLAFLKVAGSAKAEKAREKMEAARDDMQKVISLAAENGLDNELFEQAESTSWLGGLGNAIQRGVLMSEMSNYTPDFLTNTLDADEMQRFIEIASEIEKLPTSSTMKRVRETKSDGFLDAMGNLLFDNPAAIPEMFVESLSSFLPATIKWLIPSAGAGAAVGAIGGPGGALAGAGVGAKASWGVASFVLEASGMALEGMQELGVDWKNPKVFAAAWTNESIRNKIQKKMVQKGVPIAAADMLTGFMAGKVMGVANHTGNAMFKGGKLLDKTAFNKAQGAVPRFTTFQKTRNAAAELGFDSTMGMSGEFLGQWAAKEPGEAWDWDAIAAEGLVGVGPGVISSALEMRGPRANYFANAPIEIGDEQTTETGTTGTVTRAGYSAPYQTFNDAESMGEYLSTLPNANPEAVEFTKGWIAKLYKRNPEAMANLKIAISPRTPDANMENRGTFEARDGHTLIYLNEKEFSADPMATFMHEAGHLARVITMDEKKLMDIWSTIGKDAQLDAYAQYYTKRVGISFKDLDEATQAKVESAFNKTDNAVLAEEWFSYQFGQYLLGQNSQIEKDVKAQLKTYADQLGDAYTQYSGTDAKGKELFKLMFDQLGLGPAPETTINQPAPQSGINSDPQAALNAMPGTPKEKSMLARALNAMAGEKLLTESASFYTNMERQAVVAASEQEADDKAVPKKDAPQKDLTPAQEAKLRAKQPEAKGSLPSQTEASETEMSQLDRLIPESTLDRKNLGRALATVRQVEKTLTDEDALNKRIDEAVNKLGNKASVGSIIAEVLRFGPMIDAAPISIIKELRKEIFQIERGEGKQRMQTTKAVEDMLAEARERIDVVVDQLENRIAEIDRQISYLDSSLQTFQERMTSRIAEVIKPSAKKYLPKEQVKTKAATQFIGEGVKDSSTDRYHKMYQSEGVANTGKYSSSDIIYVSSNGARGNRFNPVVDGKLQGEFKNIDKAIEAGAAFIMDDYAHLVKTKKYNTGELALGNYVKSKGYKRVGRTGMWTKDGKAPQQAKAKKMAMNFTSPRHGNKRDGVEGNSTMDWIRNGSRTATTRTKSQVAGIKVGDVIAFTDGKETLNVRVTKAPYPVENVTAEEWSKLESWDTAKYEEQKGKYQFQYALIKAEEKTRAPKVKEAEKEIKSLEEKKALAEAYIQVIAPEQRTFEWRDTVHSLYYVKRITKEGVSGKIPLTLGMLAKMKDFDKYEIYSSITDERQKKTENQKPHHVLWDFVNGGFDEKKVKGDRNQPKPFLGGKSLNQYLMLLEAARASARWKQQKNIGSDAITTDSRVVSYPENFSEETTFGAVVAERIRRRMNRSVKDEEGNPVKDKDGKAIPQMERVPVFTENPTTEEVLALKIAGGATLEGLGDPSDSHKDFDMALYVIERQRMQEEQISSTEAGKADLIIDIYNQFEYAEESEDPFMRVKPGAPLSKTLAQIISLTARRQFLDKYDKVIKEDVAGEDGIQRSQVLDKMRERIDGQIVEGYTELVKNPKSKLFAQRLNAVVPYPKQLVKDQSTEVNTAGFEVKDEKNFNFRRPLEDTDVTVKAENGHGAFTASKVYETFDVMKAYAKGRELKAGEFEKQRTTIDQTEQNIDRPTTMETGADLLSSVDINAVDFAQWFFSGENKSEKRKGDTSMSRGARQMVKLAEIPSSEYTEKTINQLGGGLGEGLLPFVFADFITAMHKKFGIKGFEDQIQTIRDRINEISQEQVNEQGTRTKEAGVIKPADLETLANDMVDVSKPIVQAVLDAEAIDVYGQFDPRSETVLERDTQMGEATDADENSAEMLDDSGNEDTQVASKKSDTDEKQTEAGETLFGRGDTDRQALRERIMLEYKDDPKVAGALEGMSYEQLSEFMKEDMGKEVNELLQKELERRATRREFNQAFTSDGSGKILNSDAGRVLTSDVNPNLKKATLLSKIAGDRELKKEFEAWKKEKGESLKKGSFKMNFVDRADPLKQFHRGIVNILKKVGIDENHPLYDQLNVHGRLHQYFGKGYETVEQAQLSYIEPIKDLMREYGVDLETFGKYLLARAAPSRNIQLRKRADEYLADIAKEEKEGPGSKKYQEERAKYYEGDKFILTSGIETAEAEATVKTMESDKNFKAFAEKALPYYYNMNLDALNQLAESGMIQEIRSDNKDATGFRERTAMIKAASHYDWSVKNRSSIKLPSDIGNYSYAPMQGFENETQNFLDGEAAWEEFGASGNSSGKGFDQPKSQGVLKGAFGSTNNRRPDPKVVFATSVNQFFNNAILAKKNEVSQSFGDMFEAIRDLVYPESDEVANNKQGYQRRETSEGAGKFLAQLSKLDENMIAELKKEFDKIFEPDYAMSETVKLYEYPETGDRLINVEKQLNTQFRNDPLTFVYRRDGIARLIKLRETPEGLRMADTMKNLRYESLPSVLQFFNVGTRFMARMFTSMNPAFIIPNFFRDLGTAAIHLSEDSKKKIFKDALNFKNLGKFAKAIFKTENMIAKGDNPNGNPEINKLINMPEAELAKSTHPLADIARYQKAKQMGAKIGYFRHASVPELIREIQKDLKKSKKGLTKKGLKGLNDFVESSNTAIENSIRMSTYWAAVKGGYSLDEAAVIARNVTVDFNQKGNLTQALGSLYVFFGASMNSMHRFVTSWNRRSTKDKIAMFGGIAAASMTIAMMNRLLDDDEDEEVPDYDTITSYKRDTNFIVPLPAGLPEFFNDENDTGYFSIPLPLGYNLFWTMGQVAADMFAKNVMGRGGEGLIAGTTRLMESSMNAFNPIGGSTIATIGTPSLVTPLIELYANKNFMGSAIRHADRPFEVPKPAYLQDPKSTPQHWTDLSKAINEFMGGSDTVKGSVQGMFGGNPLMYSSDEDLQFDLSGNQMRHALLGFLGGPGQIADSLLGAMITGVQGESSLRNMNDIPMFNRFLRATTYGSATRGTFYEVRDAVKNAEKAVKSAKEINPKTYTAVLNDNRELLKLSSSISQLDKQKNKMRRLKKQIEGSKTLTEEQKTQRVDDLQKKELNLMVKVIKQAQSLGIS